MFNVLQKMDEILLSILTPLIPFFLLISRLWVAWVFFRSGLTKITTWDSTLFLFQYEYQVPLLPWQLAAYMGAISEIFLPVFLALGLLTRPAAFLLFMFNIVAVISYPALWKTGFYDHQMWGLMLIVTLIFGPGIFSLDKKITDLGKQK